MPFSDLTRPENVDVGMAQLLYNLVSKNYTPHIASSSPPFQCHKYGELMLQFFKNRRESCRPEQCNCLSSYESEIYAEAAILKINDPGGENLQTVNKRLEGK